MNIFLVLFSVFALYQHKKVVVEDCSAAGAVRDCLLRIIPKKVEWHLYQMLLNLAKCFGDRLEKSSAFTLCVTHPVQPVPREDHAGNLHGHHTSICVGGWSIYHLWFSDDISLMGGSNSELQYLTNRPVDRATA